MANRLNALDMAFLALETQKTPVNVASLQILQAPKNHKGSFIRDLKDRLMKRKAGPPFNMRLGGSSLSPFSHWVVDEHFDLSYHVRHSALPKPGEMDDLLELVSRLHSRVLDRERPLWEFHLIEGLKHDRFAVYMKMHHAAIDGMGGIALLEACLGIEPDAKLRAPWEGMPAQEPGEKPRRSKRGLLAGLTGPLQSTPDLVRLIGTHVEKGLGLQPAYSPVPFTAPRTIFNQHISGARRFAIRGMSLDAIKKLALAGGVTVNDVVLAICSGALRRYLIKHRALPERSLVATVPVSIRHINRSGNQITYVSAQLATDKSDPLKRLREIHRSTSQAKQEVADVNATAATAFAVMAQGLVAVLNRLHVASLVPPPANVVISNVPGPRQPRYFAGARLLANYPLSVLVDGQALNITVVSYCDSVDFGLMACRDTVPDVNDISDYIGDAFDELADALKGEKRRRKKANGKKRASGRTKRAAKKPVRKPGRAEA